MKELTGFSKEEKESASFVISDFDDTVTTDGLIYPDALESLYKLRDIGKKTIIVTGGSAGWADSYMRLFPVDAVVAESGALLLVREKGEIKYYVSPLIRDRAEYEKKKNDLMKETEKEYAFSSDQYCRIFDVAYERKSMDRDAEERLMKRLEKMDAKILVSSIHVNVLFSPLNKAKGLESFFPLLKRKLSVDMDFPRFTSSSIALGDSRNDEELFSLIPLSVGNMRVKENEKAFSSLPKYYVKEYGSRAFARTVSLLLS
ncbi:MAG TPA: hypothetical protein IAB12_04315 [Candidatus Ornithospirochaeta avicola]|uniref:Sucrose phosphatase-like domain-containing protein n=1 Tax=Candidatus Ornithospirochaeta avicola TaxID=2840896 RepID=A0A9D1PTE1_9SPIO|nr:hypothetical protein [Candidatus Ornithospirochaeta avicola]